MTPPTSAPQAVTHTVAQLLQEAVALQQSGQLLEAGQLYQSILQTQPDHAEANHNLGMIAVQAQQPAAGLPYLVAALDAEPTRGQYWLDYIDALHQAGQTDDAHSVLAFARQQGLEGGEVEALAARVQGAPEVRLPANPAPRQTKHAAARVPSPSRGEIDALVTQFKAGRHAEVATLAKRMTARFPRFELGWKTLGIALRILGRGAEALVPLQKAAALSPRDVEVHSRLGLVLHELGRLDEAEASFRNTLQIEPRHAATHGHLAIVLHALGRLEEADAHFQTALSIDPNDARTWESRANLLACMARPKEAEVCYRKALDIAPGDAQIRDNLGKLFRRLARLDQAEACLSEGLAICPGDISLCNSLGLILMERGLPEEAETCFREILQSRPGEVAAMNNLGHALLSLSRPDEAEACFRHALELRPDYAQLHSNLLYHLTLGARAEAEAIFQEHVAFGQRFEAPLKERWPEHVPADDPERPLRIGFVSADFYNHAVASFIEPVVAHLASDAGFVLHAYYNNVVDDLITQRLHRYFAHWQPVFGLSDTVLADTIRGDGVDILIDLSGHTAGNRLLVFARKPAPLQASWMGYPGTTGLSSMDYYLADSMFLPPGRFDAQFTEKIVRLPASTPFQPVVDAPPVNDLPALHNGHLTFGSFNRPNKLSSAVVSVWAQLLRAVPDSRMLLGGMPEAGGYDALIGWFEAEGIARERLSFHPRCVTQRYLKLHHQVDICLDTFPYNGGTTTLHALWMGVPTLTMGGATAAGRSGACILGHAGLEVFVSHNAEDFVAKGIYWSQNLSALAEIRAGLRDSFMGSPMGQPKLLSNGLARGLRMMWRRRCAGLPAASFEVSLADIDDTAKEPCA